MNTRTDPTDPNGLEDDGARRQRRIATVATLLAHEVDVDKRTVLRFFEGSKPIRGRTDRHIRGAIKRLGLGEFIAKHVTALAPATLDVAA